MDNFNEPLAMGLIITGVALLVVFVTALIVYFNYCKKEKQAAEEAKYTTELLEDVEIGKEMGKRKKIKTVEEANIDIAKLQ